MTAIVASDKSLWCGVGEINREKFDVTGFKLQFKQCIGGALLCLVDTCSEAYTLTYFLV